MLLRLDAAHQELSIKRRAAAVAAEACVPSEKAEEDVDGVVEARKAAAAEGDDGTDDESGKTGDSVRCTI